jgi:hypothetical protein
MAGLLGVWLTKWGQNLSKIAFVYLPSMLSRESKCLSIDIKSL